MKYEYKYSRILFITALKQESRVLKDLINCKLIRTPADAGDLASHQGIFFLLQIGMGNKNFSDDLEAIIRKISPDLIINYGICGILDTCNAILQNYLISNIHSLIDAPIDLSLNKLWKILDRSSRFSRGRLLTTAKPVLSAEKRDQLHKMTKCELVDMEAYTIAKIAKIQHLPIIIFKCATDFADETAVKTVSSSVSAWQKVLAEGLALIIRETEHRTA